MLDQIVWILLEIVNDKEAIGDPIALLALMGLMLMYLLHKGLIAVEIKITIPGRGKKEPPPLPNQSGDHYEEPPSLS